MEAAVDSYLKLKNAPNGDVLSYQILDGLSSLVVYSVAKADSATGERLMQKALSTAVLILVEMHEIRRELFDQKPFFRFFMGILGEMDSMPDVFNENEKYYLCFR
jgi:hypothetical protein